jgi:hypothetical protein
MEKNILLVFYKLALFIGTFMLANFAIGSEQLKLYFECVSKESVHLMQLARRVLKMKELLHH